MLNRRNFLRLGSFSLAGATLGLAPWGRSWASPTIGGTGPYGALLAADANGIRLPAGFTSRVIANTGSLVSGTSYTWHDRPDGAAVFRTPGGYAYTCNAEVTPGGAGAILFDHDGNIVDAYSILSGTAKNCAGGKTEWDTWLSCEEVDAGLVYECDPFGVSPAVARPAMGTFKHEAACSNLEERRFYLTEDQSDSNLYRFTPTTWGDLGAGLLEVATVTGASVTWSAVPFPNPTGAQDETRYQVAGATDFAGGEGIVCFHGHIYFTTKGDNKVWDYHPGTQTIGIAYDASLDPSSQLTGVDNIDASRAGDLLVAEDGGNMELVLLGPDCIASPLLRVTGQSGSEVTGPAFDPTGRRLYFNSQRGTSGDGITYEITGPFRRI